MSWIFITIIGHILNGIAFIVDKSLLKSSFKRSATYAGIVGVMSIVVLVAIPWVPIWPKGIMAWFGIVSGITFVFGLWSFFAALSRGEASRIVPIVGSLIPIITILFSYVLLEERLGMKTFIGIGLLCISTFLFTRGGSSGKPTNQAIMLGIISAVLFALSSVAIKCTFTAVGFLSGFIVARISSCIMGIIILFIIDRKAGAEVLGMYSSSHTSKKSLKSASIILFVGQVCGSMGTITVQWGTSAGSASIVNALQAVQYAFLVMIGLIFRKRAKMLLGEEVTRETLFIKGIALLFTAAGLYLIV